MVIDTSALVAILEQEDDAGIFSAAIAEATAPIISAATVVEVGMIVLSRHGEAGSHQLDELLREAQIEVVPVTEAHARLAREGFARFGKGRHPAKLNFGDCFSYALARASGHTLLFKGNDFAQTDVEVTALDVQGWGSPENA